MCFALGRTLPILLAARILQGSSSAVVFTIGYALLFDVVGQEQIGQAMGYTATGMSIGLLAGPIMGGYLYEYGGYVHVFIPAFVLIPIEVILRMMIPDSKRASGIKSMAASHQEEESPITYGTTPRVPIREISSSSLLSNDNSTRENLETVLAEEVRSLLPSDNPRGNAFLSLLRSARFLVAITSLLILNGIGTGFDAVLPAYVKDEFGLNSLQAASFFLLMGLPMLLGPLAGALSDKYGPKCVAISGLIIAIPSLFLLRFITSTTTFPEAKLGILLFAVGFSFLFTLPSLMTEVSTVAEEIERKNPGIFGKHGAHSQAYGLMNTAFAAGSFIGPLCTGFIRDGLGWPAMTLLMSVLSLMVTALVLWGTGGSVKLPRVQVLRDGMESTTGT
ncbi:MAG: hypothetical protein Q9214_003425 [Letrouitia sp. 1 TL-2023]